MTDRADRTFRQVQVISVALVTGVVMFTAVGAFLATMENGPRADIPIPFAVVVAVALVTFIGAARVQSAMLTRPVTNADDAAATFQMAVIVGQALRESVGLLGVAVGFLTGDLIMTVGLGLASVATMLVAFPKRDDLEALLRRAEARD